MFRGIHAVTLDAKGRIAIPSRYRLRLIDEIKRALVLTIDTEETCLLLYPQSAWETIEKKIEELPSFNKATRRIQRLLIGHATEVDMDKQGRILLPPLLRDYASIDKHIVLLGQGSKFELWDENCWRKRRNDWLSQHQNDSSQIPDQLRQLTL